MRSLIGIGLVAAAALAAPMASAQSVQLQHYSTSDTSIGALLDDPAARAILDRRLPGFSDSPQLRLVRGATLRSIQGYALKVLTDQVLAGIDADLATLPPRLVTQLSRATTDESKVRPYVLPDPLVLANGRPVRDAATWREKRRPEILRMFEELEYGKSPGRPPGERFEVFDRGSPALGGLAIRRQVLVHLFDNPAAPAIQVVEYLPAKARKPSPMLLMIGFTAPSAMFADAGIKPSLVWDAETKRKVAPSGSPIGTVDVRPFLEAGIGVAGFYYGDVDPDFTGGYPYGVRSRLDGVPEDRRASDAWGSIGAWAWGLSRVQDYLETDPAVDARRVAITGASRLGKTVLWAAAQDQRFAAVIACCSGKLGASLLRRNFGATVGEDSGTSDFWMAPAFQRFHQHEDELPVDSHMLLALIAPRPVLLQTGAHDYASDPKGEFLAEVAAGPVYRLLGAQDLGPAQWPPKGPILKDLGYTMHPGGHGVDPGDWDIYRQFLEIHFGTKP
jgi:hypothetical protein